MWDCAECLCRAIAASLLRCPMCGEERDMAKTTVGGGATNARAPRPETGAAPVLAEAAAAPEPAEAVVPPSAPEPSQAVSEPPAVTGEGGIVLPPLGAAVNREDDADG